MKNLLKKLLAKLFYKQEPTLPKIGFSVKKL